MNDELESTSPNIDDLRCYSPMFITAPVVRMPTGDEDVAPFDWESSDDDYNGATYGGDAGDVAYVCSECHTAFPRAAPDGAPFVCFYCKDRLECTCVPCRQCTRRIVHRHLATAPYCSILCAQHALRERCESTEQENQSLREEIENIKKRNIALEHENKSLHYKAFK